MPRKAKYPFLVQQGGSVWHVRLDIPADVRRAFGGKKVFIRTTKLTDPDAAGVIAQQWVGQWKAQIEAARNGAPTPRADDIAKRFAALKGEPEMAEFYRITEVVEFVAKELSGLSDAAWQEALAAHNLDPASALRAVKGQKAVDAVTGLTTTRTPFAAKADVFEEAHRKSLNPKTVYQYGRDIRNFADAQAVTVEAFGATHVQAFVNARCSDTDIKTVRRQVTALRAYWTWLASQDDVLKARRPFEGIVWPKSARKTFDPTADDALLDENDGPRFSPERVCDLWDAAHASGNLDLRDAIVIAAFTGARREGVMRLHVNTVRLDDPVPYLRLVEKTEAGDRRVPVHPDLLPILRQRVARPQPDGYLFRGGDNKVESRGARLTNPMRALLNANGIGAGFGFHSFRRTFVDLLQQAAVTELFAAKLVGHRITTLTYGLYAGGLPLADAARIMNETVKYPRRPDF